MNNTPFPAPVGDDWQRKLTNEQRAALYAARTRTAAEARRRALSGEYDLEVL
jgi:hypothetical protein